MWKSEFLDVKEIAFKWTLKFRHLDVFRDSRYNFGSPRQ